MAGNDSVIQCTTYRELECDMRPEGEIRADPETVKRALEEDGIDINLDDIAGETLSSERFQDYQNFLAALDHNSPDFYEADHIEFERLGY